MSKFYLSQFRCYLMLLSCISNTKRRIVRLRHCNYLFIYFICIILLFSSGNGFHSNITFGSGGKKLSPVVLYIRIEFLISALYGVLKHPERCEAIVNCFLLHNSFVILNSVWAFQEALSSSSVFSFNTSMQSITIRRIIIPAANRYTINTD